MTTKALEKIIKTAKERFPNKMPTKQISKFGMGVKVGEQKMIAFFENMAKELTSG